MNESIRPTVSVNTAHVESRPQSKALDKFNPDPYPTSDMLLSQAQSLIKLKKNYPLSRTLSSLDYLQWLLRLRQNQPIHWHQAPWYVSSTRRLSFILTTFHHRSRLTIIYIVSKCREAAEDSHTWLPWQAPPRSPEDKPCGFRPC